MGTRSSIMVQKTNGSWARIYCHWDGYLSNNGKLLQNHYNSQALAEALMTLGDLSSLGKEVGEKHDFDFSSKFHDDRDNPENLRLKKMCNAYGRDRGEDGTEASVGPTLVDVWSKEEYNYVWSREHGNPEGEWYVSGENDKLYPLVEALESGDSWRE
jgi:hypothetical protein